MSSWRLKKPCVRQWHSNGVGSVGKVPGAPRSSQKIRTSAREISGIKLIFQDFPGPGNFTGAIPGLSRRRGNPATGCDTTACNRHACRCRLTVSRELGDVIYHHCMRDRTSATYSELLSLAHDVYSDVSAHMEAMACHVVQGRVGDAMQYAVFTDQCTQLHLVDVTYSLHTHTHPFKGPFSGSTQVSRYQKGKTNLCWRGYLSGARCRLAYGPADATATHCLLLGFTFLVPER